MGLLDKILDFIDLTCFYWV